jgi:hypothetical protein
VPPAPYQAPRSAEPVAAPVAPPPAAEPEDATEKPKRDYGWNLGAGLTASSFSQVINSRPAGLSALGASYSDVPGYGLSLERHLAGSSWIFLGVIGSYSASDAIISSDTAPDRIGEVTSTQLAALLGLRQIVVSHVVDVSLWAAFGVGREFAGGEPLELEESSSNRRPGSGSTTVGVVAGLAVERELIEALAVRVSAQLGSARFSSAEEIIVETEDMVPVERTIETERRSFELAIRPGIDLRLYF